MSEVNTLKECLKEVNCHLKVLLKKHEILKEEKKKDIEIISEKHEAYRRHVLGLNQANKDLQENNEDLRSNCQELLQNREALGEELINKTMEVDRLREQVDLLGERLAECEEKLSLANIQAETYRNDFNLERESREKLNDEKLKLEEALKKPSIHPINGETVYSRYDRDGKDTEAHRCFICNHEEKNPDDLTRHVIVCLEKNTTLD